MEWEDRRRHSTCQDRGEAFILKIGLFLDHNLVGVSTKRIDKRIEVAINNSKQKLIIDENGTKR